MFPFPEWREKLLLLSRIYFFFKYLMRGLWGIQKPMQQYLLCIMCVIFSIVHETLNVQLYAYITQLLLLIPITWPFTQCLDIKFVVCVVFSCLPYVTELILIKFFVLICWLSHLEPGSWNQCNPILSVHGMLILSPNPKAVSSSS